MKESPVVKGWAIAHYVEHGMREAYTNEKYAKTKPKEEGDEAPQASPSLAGFRQGGGRR